MEISCSCWLRVSVVKFAVLPRICACFFSELSGYFEGLQVASFWVCFVFKWLFFGKFLCFVSCIFSTFYGTYMLFQFVWNAVWACFCMHLLILGSFTHICIFFVLIYLFLFCSVFLWNVFWGWISVKLRVGLVLSDLLACFRKITCDHCSASRWQDKPIC